MSEIPVGEVEESLALLDRVVRQAGGSSRPQQEAMTRAVTEALLGDRNLVVQAGTGVGKSLGYLVPVFLRAASTRETQIISTSSLALQRQILVSDGPLVQRVLREENGTEVDLQVLKGWSNYLCKYRLSGGLQDEMLWQEASAAKVGAQEVEHIREWAENTETGDRDEIDFPVRATSWQQVSVSKRECIGSSCPFVEECFPAMAKERAFAADVVVTNHSLLGIYANGRAEVLPEFGALVIDEAHELAARVRQQGNQHLGGSTVAAASRPLRDLSPLEAADLRSAGDRVEDALEQLPEGLIRLRSDALRQAMRELDDAVRAARKSLSGNSAGAKKSDAAHLARGRLDSLREVLDAWDEDPEKSITWLTRTGGGNPRLSIAPLHVSTLLANHLLADQPTIFASATLMSGGTFQSFRYQAGVDLAERAVEEIDVGTPFNPAKQGILYVASHLEPPRRDGRGDQFYEELVQLAKASGGGMLGLFSSTSGMEAATAYLREHSDLRILLQGEDSLPSLIRDFSEDMNACLIGTLSLWQGVDIPGLACRLVVMDKIPFPRPDDPIVQAETRLLAARGRNAFTEVSLAPAATLMAQGAGRLLRKLTDRGVVAVLDSRISTRGYGSYVKRSLPPFWQTEDQKTVLAALGRLAQQAQDTESR